MKYKITKAKTKITLPGNKTPKIYFRVKLNGNTVTSVQSINDELLIFIK